MTEPRSILVLRFGALGDVLHALPAVASLKLSFPSARLSWVVRPQWIPVLEGNPYVDTIIPYPRGEGLGTLFGSLAQLSKQRPDLAVDLQGLIQSALAGRLARPAVFWGFCRGTARESFASAFYSNTLTPEPSHRIERNLQLIRALGARQTTNESWLPEASPEGSLPDAPFVLASPFAGWASKQWPLERYRELGRLLAREHIPLVLNVAPHQTAGLDQAHSSSLLGLVYATRRAAAIVGVDSGPLHLAAALRKPGIAIFGPTDPMANGPYGGTIQVIRKPGFVTTYKRESQIHPSMSAVSAQEVFDQLVPQLRAALSVTGPRN